MPRIEKRRLVFRDEIFGIDSFDECCSAGRLRTFQHWMSSPLIGLSQVRLVKPFIKIADRSCKSGRRSQISGVATSSSGPIRTSFLPTVKLPVGHPLLPRGLMTKLKLCQRTAPTAGSLSVKQFPIT
jgi:hypothetical protein